MTDLALAFDPALDAADLCIANGDLALDDGLGSLVLSMLLTDARAEARALPKGDADRRGWWGDALEDGSPWGGLLWLLAREKTTADVLNRARDYAEAALQPLISDGIAASVEVAARREDRDGSGAALTLEIAITRPSNASGGGERVNLLYDRLWRAT